MSRNQAKRQFRGRDLQEQMEKRGILVRTASYSGLAEEAGPAYKDVDAVIEAADLAGSRLLRALTDEYGRGRVVLVDSDRMPG